jgi:hypothetical protein
MSRMEDRTMTKHTDTVTLRGPAGISITLDASEIFPNDPGAGTPAMVECRGHTATYWCALDTGELGCGDYLLSDAQCRWLHDQAYRVDKFVSAVS